MGRGIDGLRWCVIHDQQVIMKKSAKLANWYFSTIKAN
jgi:hypothetical protein